MAFGEWEVMFVFAGFMGPAEVAVWGLLGDLWEAMEEIGLASADAAEVRVAYLLGSGQTKRARYCAHKSLFVSVVVAVLVVLPVIAFHGQLPGWFTHEETLQGMLAELVPYMCMGNVAMVFGSMTWSLLGAQDRFGLATAMGFIGSWGVTLPLSAGATILCGYDLQGLASSVVIGYTCSGAPNLYFLLRSNWEKVAWKIQNKSKLEEEGVTWKDHTTHHHNKAQQTKAGRLEHGVEATMEVRYGELDWNALPHYGTHHLRIGSYAMGTTSSVVFPLSPLVLLGYSATCGTKARIQSQDMEHGL